MDHEPLDDLYLTWLYCQVGNEKLKNPRRTHWNLLRQLYSKEFIWIVPNDDNRVEDGKNLRDEFIYDAEIPVPEDEWMNLGCSFLEMLVGLSRRMAFEAEGDSADWFWHLMDNLRLRQYNDATKFDPKEVDDKLERVIWRQFEYDGTGGLFPLRDAREDQREIELWYQLAAYVLELA